MDELDRRIIAFLQLDGRASNVEIARALGVAEATVRKRIERLLAEGVIRIVAIPSVDKLGLEVETVILLKVEPAQALRIGEQLAAMKEVRAVRYTTGEYDLIVEAVFPSNEDLLHFLTNRLASIPGIRATATSYVLKSIKQHCDWILPREGPPLILVVDDDPDFVEFTRMVLEKAGYRVIAAANGEQGLQAMRQEQPDLVILDVMMSGILDGLNASMRMRTVQGLEKTPILMVSSITSSDYAAMFPTDEYVPVESFLSKPVSPEQLLSEIQRLLP
ncbi:MAG: response regulator [Chloroflexi bacterium]|nr:response regulator [Chloroflexota bacterium]